MDTVTEIEENETNLLEMSDEEFLNSPIPDMSDKTEEDKEDSVEDSNEEVTEEEEEDTEDSSNTENYQQDTSDVSSEEEKTTHIQEDNEKLPSSDTSNDIDYKSEYEKLLAPFKANNREMQVSNVDEALSLMKMGANYNKKMEALKPNLKLIKMLEKNGLLEEDKLNFLIDLDKKNPEAIAKFMADSGVDPLDIDTENSTNYTPNTYNVNDKEVELDEVLDEIRDSPSFSSTIEVIGNKWDDRSKQVLLETPQIIKIINDHMETGIYKQINDVVEKERMLGRLSGLSDLEAYKAVGDAIQANGGFNTPNTQTAKQNRNISSSNTGKVNSEIKSKKKAASSTKSTANKTNNTSLNALSLSDEEFEKLTLSKYL